MTVAEFLKQTHYTLNKYKNRNRVYCNDGFNISIQASSTHYSIPRTECAEYTAVELGFPSSQDELINEYAESTYDYTATVYGYVPIEIVERLIEKHNGIDVKLTLSE